MELVNDQLVQDLKAARAVIEKPETWTKGFYAHTATGEDVESEHPDATCWCVIGAVEKVTSEGHWMRAQNVIHYLGHYVPRRGYVAKFNDDPNTTHEDILAVFDKAIAAATDPTKRL